MGWPTPQEYNEAIQNPRSAFDDPELRAGQPVLTALGLPRPITGAFASVYQLVCAQGRTVAVRCFLRDFGDHQDRYAAISAHLARVRLPYMTNFTYLANGIRVNGRWYPILKMDWLEGEALQTYVERNLNQPDALRSLAAQWVEMAKNLRIAQIGHGDLQHGNVIVSGGQLRLIDYDGMFVPTLAGRQSHEIGHRNYQHPQRSERDFDPGIDHFSTWVVYTSLVALAEQPQLWRNHAGGDECLIFRREDFERPAASPLFRSLETAADPRLVSLAGIFRSHTLQPSGRVPPIDGPINWPVNGTVNGTAAGTPPPAAADWLHDHVGKPQAAPPVAAPVAPGASAKAATPAAAGAKTKPAINVAGAANSAGAEGGAAAGNAPSAAEPSWISDFIGGKQTAAIGFGGDLAQQRQALRTPLMLVVLTWIGFQWFGLAVAAPATVTAVAAVDALAMLAGGYRQYPHVQALRREQRALREAETQVRRTNRRLQAMQNKQGRVERKFARRRERLEANRQHSKGEEQAALARHDQRLQAALSDAQRRRAQLQQAGVDTVRKLQANHAVQLAALDKQIAGLRQEEENDLRQTLARRQQQFVTSYMKRQTIDAAVIGGIGASVKETLRKHGIMRAMDLEARRLAQVEGIGEARTRVLLDWRRKAEALATQTAPQSLSKIEETLIRGRFLQRRFSLEQEKGKAERKLAKEVAEAQQRNAEQLKVADEEPQKLRTQSAQKRDEIRTGFQQRRTQAQSELAALVKEIAGQQAVFDQEATTVQTELALLNAQRAGIEYRLQRYEGLQFGAYLRRVVLGE